MRIALIFSIILNILLILYLLFGRTQGVLEIDYSKENPRWLFLLKISTDRILNYRTLKFLVRDVTDIVKENERKDAEKSDDIMGGLNNEPKN